MREMARLFIDSSALLKRYRSEAGSERVSELLEGADSVVISRLATVEVSAALVRRARATKVAPADLQAALADFDADLAWFDIVELDEELMGRAVAVARAHRLRGADAIQLACALWAREDAGRVGIAFVGSDRELNEAAAAEGMQIIDPSV